MPYSPSDGYIPLPRVIKRYARSRMWLSRIRGHDANRPHAHDPNFPKPAMVVNGREYWRLADLEEWEKSNAPA
jgi:hypothetical protein